MFSIKMNFCIILVLLNYINVLSFEYYHHFNESETIDRSAQSCGFSARDKCLEPMKKFLSLKQISFGKNENEFSENCRKVQKAISCFDEFLQNCNAISARIRDRIQRLLNSHQNLQNELCRENTSLRQKYLVFGNCIENNLKEMNQCYKNYEKEIMDAINEIPFQTHKFGYIQMDSICCALENHNICARNLVESRCNKSGSQVFQQFFQMNRYFFNDCPTDFLMECNGSEVVYPKLNIFCLVYFSISLIITYS